MLTDPHFMAPISSPDLLPKLPAAAALEWLQAGRPVRGYHIVGTLALCEYQYIDYPVEIANCWVDELSGPAMSYRQPVRLLNSRFGRCEFLFAYFLQGLTMADCTFDHYLDFHAGGHNKPGFQVLLQNNIFNGFVNFFDCWYEAEVQVEGNDFRQGSNLLGSPQGYPVEFDVSPIIQNNTGDLTRNDEGEAAEPTLQ
ncbi:hypothetical protein [Hymenobacter sp. APR13]|uniref:hypothetical protein n=1 Tax=Hymenobacter sp. APR13 TaxID=1356852 RepID=UPI000B0F3D76|nr:hypothetical protein [Hymenobacter sp. APR13]